MTPYSSRTLDRWGNVTGYEEGGYEFVNGQPVFAPIRLFRSYGYDDNNQRITEILGTHEFVPSSGGSTSPDLHGHCSAICWATWSGRSTRPASRNRRN